MEQGVQACRRRERRGRRDVAGGAGGAGRVYGASCAGVQA